MASLIGRCTDSGRGKRFFVLFIQVFLVLLLAESFVGCRSKGRTRPVGFMRLGPAAELAQRDETFFSEARILLRYDSRGFSAMSTACTYDLSPLTGIHGEEGRNWRSSYSSSTYDDRGRVVRGPAEVGLPYYSLKLAPGSYGGPADTLFVEIGAERSEDWRLSFSLREGS